MANKDCWIKYHCHKKGCSTPIDTKFGESYAQCTKKISHKCHHGTTSTKLYSKKYRSTDYSLTIESLSPDAYHLLPLNIRNLVDASCIVEQDGENEDEQKMEEAEEDETTEALPLSDITNLPIDDEEEDNVDYDEDSDIMDVDKNESNHKNHNNYNSNNHGAPRELRTYARNDRNRNSQKRSIHQSDQECVDKEITVCFSKPYIKKCRVFKFRKRNCNKNSAKKLTVGDRTSFAVYNEFEINPNLHLLRNKTKQISCKVGLDDKTVARMGNKQRKKQGIINKPGGQRGANRKYDVTALSNAYAGRDLEQTTKTFELPHHDWF